MQICNRAHSSISNPLVSGDSRVRLDIMPRLRSLEKLDDLRTMKGLEAVREKMLDIEDFNQLLDRVRHLITEQEQLLDETKKVQKKSVLDLLK